jgi:glycosyltransferase involved in cell wall biosynthesis
VTNRSILLLFLGDATRDRRVQNFARFFAGEGWSVEVIAIQPTILRGPRKFLQYHRCIQKEVREKQADVVMACDLYSLSAAAWMKRHGRVQVLLYDARELYTELPAVAQKPLAKFVWRTLERRGLIGSNLIIVTAPNDADAILRVHNFLPRPILVRNMPWREPDLKPDRAILDRFGILNDAKTVAYLGGLQQGRGLEKLIEAMTPSPYHDMGRQIVHLLLIGDGNLRARLEARATSNVHFAGSMRSDEALRTVAACDVGISLVEPVSASYKLALPSKHFEYMMCGIPIVSSNISQVLDLFRNEEWVTFVNERDANSISTGIQKALANSDRTDLREREKYLALNEYHFEHDATRLSAVLKNILL